MDDTQLGAINSKEWMTASGLSEAVKVGEE